MYSNWLIVSQTPSNLQTSRYPATHTRTEFPDQNKIWIPTPVSTTSKLIANRFLQVYWYDAVLLTLRFVHWGMLWCFTVHCSRTQLSGSEEGGPEKTNWSHLVQMVWCIESVFVYGDDCADLLQAIIWCLQYYASRCADLRQLITCHIGNYFIIDKRYVKENRSNPTCGH